MAMTVTAGHGVTPLVVVVLRAKRTSAWLVSSTMTMHPSAPRLDRRGQRVLNDLWAAIIGHRPASARALRMFTPRTSTEGQPWLTGAT